MFEGMTFDELNELNKTSRSMDIDEYFDEMDISESEKKRRKTIAEQLEDGFLLILALLFTMRQYGSVDYEEIKNRFEETYKNALKQVKENPDGQAVTTYLIQVDNTVSEYIKSFSQEVTDSTKAHEDELYYYSSDRARFMAECEANNVGSYQEFKEALKAGYKKKQWITIHDGREREAHAQANGQVKEIYEPFIVGGEELQYPRDASNASAWNIVNCRCSLKFIK